MAVVRRWLGGHQIGFIDFTFPAVIICSHLEWSECDRLLIVIVPGAPQFPGLVPHLLHQGVVLDDDGVLHEAAGRVGLAVCLRIATATHAAAVEENLKAGRNAARAGREVVTVGVAVESFTEDHPVERAVELDVDPDARLLALNLDIHDLREVWLGGGPDIIVLTTAVSSFTKQGNNKIDNNLR